ncbi:hypothetical protein [Spirosoma foliorum]|uniref:SGNH hydrolase-type esterase domain-containing protein n=1 Tax=Spirosoma foliorum TaxID=2710596 RepID=A0A7G5GYN5_9BACT|nr:hypothetical protein [Spirosoma foliorum]QMW03977.1 hypothetical protein H3H32_03190 [Spirosoma foliorum]
MDFEKYSYKYLIRLAYIILILLLIEIVLRYYGFHQFPLFEENKNYEYIHKPNQNTLIYRNKFITNEYSMRSNPVSKYDSLVVLLIGDSVLNGTNQVDQDSLASTILEDTLKKSFNKNVRVLNVSSYTWGPDNVYSYLKSHGTFNADIIVSINNSGDAYDNMTFEPIVGLNPSMPSENYTLAIISFMLKEFKVFQNCVLYSKSNLNASKTGKFNKGFQQINDLALRLNIPLLVYMHASREEISLDKYNEDGKKIISFFKENNREVICDINYTLKNECYLDDIHLSAKGQRFMGEILYPHIYNLLKNLDRKDSLLK